jgi:hypothetical protein
LAFKVGDVEPGIYPLQVSVSDQDLTREGSWRVEVLSADSTVIDDLDSINFDGIWIRKSDPFAYGGWFHVI